jgi:hypothetical protein
LVRLISRINRQIPKLTRRDLDQGPAILEAEPRVFFGSLKVMWWPVPAPAASSPRVIVANESHHGAIHMQIASIGLDIAKNVF